MSAKTSPSFEAYCKCFAGIYRKHTQSESRSFFTCYVRDAISTYLGSSEERRRRLIEWGVREEIIGYLIAKSMLAQGWSTSHIYEYADEQQQRVNDAECYSDLDFTEALEVAGYSHHAFARESNGARYAWMLDGSPYITDCLDPAPEDDY